MRFEEIITYENLYKAHRVARLGKRNKKEVIEFEMNLSQSLWNMYYDLIYDKYKIGNYHCFKIYDPKEREIQAIGYRDRILQHVLCDNYLMPLLDSKLIYYNVACRKGKGTSLAIKALRKFMTKHYKKYGNSGYFIKADIRKYFDNIDHDLLKIKLKDVVNDEKILKLLYQIIDTYGSEENKGLPLGNQTSQNFALLYLDYLDKYITCKLGIKYYVRYMDDIIIIVENKEKAKEIFKKLEEKVINNKLMLNPKSQIISIKCGVSFLGWTFFYNKNGGIIQKIKKESKQRIIKHFRFSIKKRNNNLSFVLTSYKGYLQKGNTYYIYNKLLNSLYNKTITIK